MITLKELKQIEIAAVKANKHAKINRNFANKAKLLATYVSVMESAEATAVKAEDDARKANAEYQKAKKRFDKLTN